MNDQNDIPPDQLPFHYNREERLNQAPDNVKNKSYSHRKRFVVDRRLLIIMIDIVIVVIAFFGITAYQKSKARIGDFEGVRLEVVALEYDGEILASLKVENLEKAETGRIIEASFYLIEGEERTVSDLIPTEEGGRRILRESLEPIEGANYLKVRVRIGDKEAELEKRISGE